MRTRARGYTGYTRTAAATGLIVTTLLVSTLVWTKTVWAEGDKNRQGLGASDIWDPDSEVFPWLWIPILIFGMLIALVVLRHWRRNGETKPPE